MKKRFTARKARCVFLRILPEIILIGLIVIILAGLYDCPMNAIFHIPCPGCNMTEAMFAFLRLDFSSAFRENFLFPIPIFWCVYSLLRRKYAFSRKVENLLVCISAALFLLRWIFILIFT